MTKFKKLALAAVSSLALGYVGTASALEYFTAPGCTPNCWDFTVYTSQTPQTVTPSSLGFVEGFLKYDTPVSGNAATASLVALYFTSTGISTAGATTSSWAPIVNLNLPVNIPDPVNEGQIISTTSGIVGGTSLLQISSVTPGSPFTGTIKTTPSTINFSVDGTSYQLILSNGTRNSSIASLNTTTGQYELLGIGQNYYTNTSADYNRVGAGTFGGQIAPEMDAQSAFNVFALLGCLALIYSKRKSFSETSEGLRSIA